MMFDVKQQSDLGLRKATRTFPNVNGVTSSGCVWLGRSDVDYNTQTIRIGAEVAATDPERAIINIGGFGAVRNVVHDLTTGSEPTCQVTVDAAQGQSIRVQALGDTQRPRTDDEMCRLATEAAQMVMTTVVATASR